MNQEILIGALAALGGAVATVVVAVLTYRSKRRETWASHEATVLRASHDLIESLQREVVALRDRILAQEGQLLAQAQQIMELRRQLGIGGD